ncbi:MAG: alpha/beta hydrolase fold domain-containing protein [Lachnospiraceae bacterium]|nr:alpha/beta hydrolase fold domain-containing protein [Lachnospiraceae bacterium]
MALFQVSFLSEALKRITTFHAFLPNDTLEGVKINNPNYDRPPKTLFLLHGYTGSSADWICGSDAMMISRRYNLAIVMPSGENSFYIDRKTTGHAYETYISSDLPSYVSKSLGLSLEKNDIFIGGLSMGGYGALRLALKNPETYGAAFGLSSALITEDIKKLANGEKSFAEELANREYYEEIFGDLKNLDQSDKDPGFLVRRNKTEHVANPPLYMACGTEDPLLENNRVFAKYLRAEEVDITYVEEPGIHEWDFWTRQLEPAVVWALNRLA